MLIVSEETVQKIVTAESAFASVEAVFGAMACGDAYNFPVIREAIGYADALYGFKSGFDRAGKALGLKSGGYWPGNMEKGLILVLLLVVALHKPCLVVPGRCHFWLS